VRQQLAAAGPEDHLARRLLPAVGRDVREADHVPRFRRRVEDAAVPSRGRISLPLSAHLYTEPAQRYIRS
jgi:hypothetical protein